MKLIKCLTLLYLLCATLYCQSALAGDRDYLLINLTSYTTHESRKAIDYAKAELTRGRPVIIFLNDQGVLVAAKANAGQFKEQQHNLNELMERGARILVCPHCMKLYAVAESDLLAGIQIADEPDQS